MLTTDKLHQVLVNMLIRSIFSTLRCHKVAMRLMITSLHNTAESAGERILKISQYLVKLLARVECAIFWLTGTKDRLCNFVQSTIIVNDKAKLTVITK